ncbi:MAG: transposase [Treponema sp.]|nr:transposase [Treponema sp.]
MIICADGLTGIKEAITAAFPKTDYQRCMVHMVRKFYCVKLTVY